MATKSKEVQRGGGSDTVLHYVEPGTRLRAGTQIAYVPQHADGLDHRDVEFGFVASIAGREDTYFCRYWSKHTPNRLRTVANGESTPLRCIVLHDTVPQEIVDKLLFAIVSPPWGTANMEDIENFQDRLFTEYGGNTLRGAR